MKRAWAYSWVMKPSVTQKRSIQFIQYRIAPSSDSVQRGVVDVGPVRQYDAAHNEVARGAFRFDGEGVEGVVWGVGGWGDRGGIS